jgi:hypothetical protein
VLVIAPGNFRAEHRPVPDPQRLFERVALGLEPVSQVGQIVLNRGLVGAPVRPQALQPGHVALSRGIEAQFELAFGAEGGVGKAQISHTKIRLSGLSMAKFMDEAAPSLAKLVLSPLLCHRSSIFAIFSLFCC